MGFSYIVAKHNDSTPISDHRGEIKAKYQNLVNIGELVFWEIDSGSIDGCHCGRVADIEHTPKYSVLRVIPK